MKEAMLYEKLEGGRVRCNLCSHTCTVLPSKQGICGVRENRDGILYTLVYGTIIAENVDPIEKKPLFHVYPGSRSFSVATVGCNFQCTFCQNSDISQMPRERGKIIGREVTPEELIEKTLTSGSKTIAYTYTEPTIFFELAYDTAKIAGEKGIKNVFVTNGFMTDEAIETISPYLDAANVDLKSFDDGFYKKYCGGRLQPVLDSLKKMKELGIWVEVTTLIIPTLNDSDEELSKIARFIHSLGNETPWHISRFHPQYKMIGLRPTPLSTLKRAKQIGTDAGLKYVYTGNVPGDEGENTYCSNCGNLIIGRYGFRVDRLNLKGSQCSKCGTEMEGIL
ncbi:MAG: AmmeMemoRadiSam system radical SAM enzyme [Deltaproteobacteria bacterium]|nr:AmmeMemoRadiSam system radical SAM enzyme [Deltaproteobacteria bacterium]MBN2845025.1 AmmeMemoRadiSam system radical SAM enzyme [Deltaproteobacteria bacterium]